MKLLTHNFLACNVKGVKNGYPLGIDASKVEVREADMDPDFVKKMLLRIDYGVLKQAAQQLGVDNMPAEASDKALEDPDVVQRIHHALMEVHLEEGALVCPESQRRFPVSQGIPNMLLNEDEV